MKAAAAVCAAAALFLVAAVLGLARVGSSPPAPPGIDLRGLATAPRAAGVPESRQTRVPKRVEEAGLSRYLRPVVATGPDDDD